MWLALLSACTSPKDPADDFAGILPAISVRGVIVLHVDTLRADHLPAYGYDRDTTPRLSRRPWRIVEGERATTSWTMPSTASFLTSLEPERHGLLWWHGFGPNGDLLGQTWASRLGEEGWATALFTGNPFASAQTHLDAGFDVVDLSTKDQTGQRNLAALGDELLAWLDTLPAGQPFMAHLQPMELHNPYSPAADDLARFRDDELPFDRPEFDGYTETGFADAWAAADDPAAVDQAVVDIYDASLVGLDREIDGLLVALDERGLLDDTLVVLTSDHGQTLDDPGGGVYGHEIGWREELVRLPLMFLHPDVPEGRVACIAENVDVWPTIAGAIGVAPIPEIDGADLADGCRSGTRGSLWDNDGTLETLGQADASGALQRDCRSGTTAGTAVGEGMAVGEGTDPTETTPVDGVPNGAALNAGIDAHAEGIGSWVPGADCPG